MKSLRLCPGAVTPARGAVTSAVTVARPTCTGPRGTSGSGSPIGSLPSADAAPRAKVEAAAPTAAAAVSRVSLERSEKGRWTVFPGMTSLPGDIPGDDRHPRVSPHRPPPTPIAHDTEGQP